MVNILTNKRMHFSIIITLFFIVLIGFIMALYPNFSEDTVNNNANIQPIKIYKNEDNKEQPSKILQVKKDTVPQQCERDCLAIIAKLAENNELSTDDLAFIIENAATLANRLKTQPEVIAILLGALQDDEDTNINQHDAAYAVIEYLSIEDKTEIALQISSSIDTNDRISALKLLQEGVKYDSEAVETFLSILITEYDPAVQIMAINMTRQITGENNQEKARNALDAIIQSNSSDYSSGEAVLAKVYISSSPSTVSQDIVNLMSSTSTDLQLYGLQAFETSMEHYNKEFDAGNGWQEEERIKQSIQAISQDTFIDTKYRNKAQEMIEQFF